MYQRYYFFFFKIMELKISLLLQIFIKFEKFFDNSHNPDFSSLTSEERIFIAKIIQIYNDSIYLFSAYSTILQYLPQGNKEVEDKIVKKKRKKWIQIKGINQ